MFKKYGLFFLAIWAIWSWTPQQAHAACATTRVYLLLDVSGSMKGVKHTSVRNAIRDLTSQHKNTLEFGFATFGSNYNHRVNVSSTGWQTIYNTVNNYASNENYTRMGTALRSSGAYLWGLKQQESASTRNRPYYIVLITDGYPTGENVDPTGEARKLWNNYKIKTFVIGIQFNATLLNSIAQKGETKQAYNANNQSSLNTAFNSIASRASAEVCDNLDNDCDGSVDEQLTKSCSSGCGSGTQTCTRGVWSTCSSSQNARPERCNNKDDDCDGSIDEDFQNKGKSCGTGTGGCKANGTYLCKADGSGLYCSGQSGTPKPETCNGRDDDCDGRTDEGLTQNCSTACGSGVKRCLFGFWLPCTAPEPKVELCDGKDNDCDGSVDEDWTLLRSACQIGGGNCAKTGTWQCNSTKTGITCVTTGSNAKPEKCNGIDDNCNGQVDENWPNKGQSCGTGTGGCQQGGKMVCRPDGTGLQCSASSGTPKPEVCDGKDNDCDGTTDEHLRRPCRTACGSGIETCQSGNWIQCTAKNPEPEKCDGQDNDCDGQVDNGLRRPCTSKCGAGNEICIAGSWKYCDAPKPQKEVCDTRDNDCNGKVDDVTPKPCQTPCGPGQQVCESGRWKACKGPSPSKEICDGKDNDCDGTIDEELVKKCTGKCGEGTQTCRNGQWARCQSPPPELEICDGKDNDCDGQVDVGAKCPAGAVCKYGRCFSKCVGGECPAGSKCEGELCNGNPCSTIKCPKGKTCAAGRCVDPCDLGTCPQGTTCKAGKCIGPGQPDPEPSTEEDPSSVDGGNPTTPDTGIGHDTSNPNNPDAQFSDTGTGGKHPPTKKPPRVTGTGCVCSVPGRSERSIPWLLLIVLMGWGIRLRTRKM